MSKEIKIKLIAEQCESVPDTFTASFTGDFLKSLEGRTFTIKKIGDYESKTAGISGFDLLIEE